MCRIYTSVISRNFASNLAHDPNVLDNKCYSRWDILGKPNLAERATVRAGPAIDNYEKEMANDGFHCNKIPAHAYISEKNGAPHPWIEVGKVIVFVNLSIN